MDSDPDPQHWKKGELCIFTFTSDDDLPLVELKDSDDDNDGEPLIKKKRGILDYSLEQVI